MTLRAADGSLRVGFSGLGRMGVPMARNIAKKGLLVGVHNRTASKASALARELDVAAYASCSDLAADANVIVTCLSDGAAVHDLYSGPSGLLDVLRPGTIVVDASTIGPDAVYALNALVVGRECELLDAPVSGSVSLADAAELTLMVGGLPATVTRLQPMFDAVGSTVFHMGPVGSGSVMKLVVNNVVYGLNQSISESLVLAERAGIDRDRAYQVFAASAVAAPFVHYRRSAYERPGAVPVAMPLAMAEKDLALILALADSVGAHLPQATLNAGLATAARRAGMANDDITAIADYLRRADPMGRAEHPSGDWPQRQ